MEREPYGRSSVQSRSLEPTGRYWRSVDNSRQLRGDCESKGWRTNGCNESEGRTSSGGDSRIIPLFPQRRKHLAEAFDEAEPCTEFVITRHSDPNAGLRSQFQRIIKRAGLQPRSKLFQNLRSSRETELAERFPIQGVCDWIGNTPKVAMRHYLQTKTAQFKAATKSLQNSTCTMSASRHISQPMRRRKPRFFRGLPRIAVHCIPFR